MGGYIEKDRYCKNCYEDCAFEYHRPGEELIVVCPICGLTVLAEPVWRVKATCINSDAIGIRIEDFDRLKHRPLRNSDSGSIEIDSIYGEV